MSLTPDRCPFDADRVLQRATDRAERWTSRLLGHDVVFGAVQRSLASTLTARRMFERNMGRLLAVVSVPSGKDLDRLLERIDDIESGLKALEERLESLTRT